MAWNKQLNAKELKKLTGTSNTVDANNVLKRSLKDTGYTVSVDGTKLKIYKSGDNYYTWINGTTGSYKTPASVFQITDPLTLATLNDTKSNIIKGNIGIATVDPNTGNTTYSLDPHIKRLVTGTDKNGNVKVYETYYDPHLKGSDNSNSTNVNNNNADSGSGAGYTVPSPDYSYYQKQINDLRAELEEYKRPKSGAELAEHYGIRDTLANQGYWEGIYTDDFNQYYDDLVNKQNEYRNRYTRNNSMYDDYLEREYINSYNNASNARTTRGAVAANALSTGNVNDYNSSKNDNAMMQNVNALEAQRVADLAGVDYKAAQTYTDVMKELMSLGANHDASMVQDIVNQLGAASTKNAAEKNYAGALASAAQTKYNGLVNSKSYNTTLNQLQNYYNYYLTKTGNEAQAANAVVNTLGTIGAGY